MVLLFFLSEPKQAKAFVRGEFYNYLLGLDVDKREDVAHGAQVMLFMYTGARPGEIYKLKTNDVFIGRRAASVTLRNRKNGGLFVFLCAEKNCESSCRDFFWYCGGKNCVILNCFCLEKF